MCPKLLDTIRPGVEVSSRELSNVSADALVLPWRGDEGILPSLLEEGAPGVLAQLREYPEDRRLRLTSAGMLYGFALMIFGACSMEKLFHLMYFIYFIYLLYCIYLMYLMYFMYSLEVLNLLVYLMYLMR